MKKKSKEYELLLNRIEQLKKHLDFEQPFEGITDEQSDILKGLILLCHAEIEDYIENIALNLIEVAEDKWNKYKISNYNLSCLFIFNDKILKNLDYITKSKKIIEDYKKNIVQTNNGIKEENIKKLFNPLGYIIDDFEAAFLASISDFGKIRGETAHCSAIKLKQQLDKKTELHRIDDILNGILDFEIAIYSKVN